jgi:hypothetical protein
VNGRIIAILINCQFNVRIWTHIPNESSFSTDLITQTA